MSSKDKKVAQFFKESELVYRRKLTVEEMAREIFDDTLESLGDIVLDDEEIIADMRIEAMEATADFFENLRKRVAKLVKKYPRTTYIHIGYYNDVADVRELAGKSADEILDYYKHGYGHFYEDDQREPESELVKEEETEGIKKGAVRFTKDDNFAVVDTSWDKWKEQYADAEDGDDSDVFIDIYEKKGYRKHIWEK